MHCYFFRTSLLLLLELALLVEIVAVVATDNSSASLAETLRGVPIRCFPLYLLLAVLWKQSRLQFHVVFAACWLLKLSRCFPF